MKLILSKITMSWPLFDSKTSQNDANFRIWCSSFDVENENVKNLLKRWLSKNLTKLLHICQQSCPKSYGNQKSFFVRWMEIRPFSQNFLVTKIFFEKFNGRCCEIWKSENWVTPLFELKSCLFSVKPLPCKKS